MKSALGNWGPRWARLLLGTAATVLPLGFGSIGDGAEPVDPCEAEARQAYWQALRLCQFAENPNPRLRCYEAARGVYFRVLQECQARQPQNRPSGAGAKQSSADPEPPSLP
jgi:hypothetical protein